MSGPNAASFQRIPTKGLLRTVPTPSLEMSGEVGAEPPPQLPNYGSDSPNDQQQEFPHEPNGELSDTQENKRTSDVSVVSRVPTCRRVAEIVLMARLEIFLALYMVARRISSTAVQDLLIYKSCLNDLALNASVCSHLDDFEEFKDMAEKAASMTNMMRAVVLLTPSAVIAIFVGPWCDKYGYRTPLVTAMLGFLTSTLLDVVTVYHMAMPLYVNILTSIPDGLCGGPICIITAVCSEATLLTKDKRRRVRFFAISVTMSLSMPLGSYVGGLLYGHFGWATVLYSTFAIAALGLVWAFVAVRNLVRPDHAQDSLSLRLRNFFQLQNLTESIKSAMKPRPNKGRLQLWCLFGVICCVMFDLASMGIAYFYVRKMYSWSVSYYSTVQSVSAVVGLVLNTPIIYLFVKVLKISDPAMALVGICFATAQMIILGLAYVEWLYYLQCLVGLPSFVGQVGIRTHLSKLVAADEVGKIFSLLASLESVVPIAGEVLLTTIFNWSISFLPGLPYLVISVITSIAIGLTAYVTTVHRYTIKYQDMSKAEVSSGPIND